MTLTIPTPQKPRRIELATNILHDENPAYDGNIKPGMLIQIVAGAQTVQRHSTLGGIAIKRFAVEEALVSRNDPAQTGGVANVDTAFASGAIVPSRVYRGGDRVNALLKAGANYTIGAQLISDGAGRLMLASGASTTTLVKQIIAEIDEIGGGVNLSATAAVDTLCSVRIW